MRFFKRILLLFVVLLLLGVVGLWLFSRSMQPETMKHFVAERISMLTHQPVHIQGELAWQIFPRPGIRMDELTIGQADKGTYHMAAQRLLLNLELTPLLRGRLVFGEVVVDGLQLDIHARESRQNHQVRAKPGRPSKTRSLSVDAERIAIQRIRLNNSKLVIHQAAQQWVFAQLQLEASPSYTEFPIKLKGQLSLQGAPISTETKLRFDGHVFMPTDLSDGDAILQKIRARGQLTLNDLQIQSLPITQMNAGLVLNDQQLRLEPLNLLLLNGSTNGSASLDREGYQFQLKQTVNGLDTQRLLAAINEKPFLSGEMNGTVHLQGRLGSALLQNLQGEGSLSLLNGRLLGVDLPGMLTVLQSRFDSLGKEGALRLEDIPALFRFDSALSAQGDTPFQIAVLPFSLQKGVLAVSGLSMVNESVAISGALTSDLANRRLQGTLGVTFTPLHVSRGLLLLQERLGGQFPLRVSGTLRQPLILPNLEELSVKLPAQLLNKALGKKILKMLR